MMKGLLPSLLICGLVLAGPLAAIAQEAGHEAQAPAATSTEAAAPAAPTEAHGTTTTETSATHETTAHGTEAHEASAHEAGAHHAQGIPMSVFYQVVNFLIFVGLLVYVLRKPIANFFRSREEIYKQALVRGEHARAEAEKKRREIQDRLQNLESSTQSSINSARAEAASLMAQITQEAKELAERLKREASRTAELEVERAKTHLREEILAQSVALSKKMLADKIVEGDQKRLQTEFVDKIQEVR